MQTVLVTGGSSGLGYALSERFAAQGARLLWVSLNAPELEEARDRLLTRQPGVEVHTLALDLATEGAVDEVHTWASAHGAVDVLVNNAGFGNYGPIHSIPVQRELDCIAVNAVALFRLTRRFLDDMRDRGAGTIVNISSNTSAQPVPGMAIYAATKAFVRQFSEALAEELRVEGSPLRVVTVCPAGIQDTPFRKVNGMDHLRTFRGLAATTVDEVTEDVFRALARGGSRLVMSGWRQRLLEWFRPFVPQRITRSIVLWESSFRA